MGGQGRHCRPCRDNGGRPRVARALLRALAGGTARECSALP
jgi:hypothetical protein